MLGFSGIPVSDSVASSQFIISVLTYFDFSLAFYLRVTVLGAGGLLLQRNKVFTTGLARESAVFGLEKCLLELDSSLSWIVSKLFLCLICV